MRIKLNPWVSVTLLAAAVTIIAFGIHSYRHRFVRTDADLFRFLPRGDSTVFYVNVAALRGAGILALLAGVKGTEDKEYANFVSDTQFDYNRDIGAIAGTLDGNGVFTVVRGHFDWTRLRQYAMEHAGACYRNTCDMATSKTGRWMSFFTIQPDVLALAFASDRSAASVLKPPGHQAWGPLPGQPVWVRVSQAVLKKPADLPLPLRIFAISMQSANPVIVSLNSVGENNGTPFDIRLDASCPTAATAETVRNQLQIQTNMLKLELARERQRPNPADLTGLLTSGTFQVVGNSVVGNWPVSKELLKTLQ